MTNATLDLSQYPFINGFGEFGDTPELKHGHFANNRPEMTSQRILCRTVIIIVVNRHRGVTVISTVELHC